MGNDHNYAVYILAAFAFFFGVAFMSASLMGCAAAAPEEELVLEDVSEDGGSFEMPGADIAQAVPAPICVYVCGAVKSPGVYELEEGSRIYELLGRCGGYLPEADSLYLNQAQTLSDGEKVYVPLRGESGEAAVQSADSQPPDQRVNINTADENELTSISGIGPSRAADIIAYRESSGAFAQVEDIMKVPGIKEGLFGRIKDSIRVR